MALLILVAGCGARTNPLGQTVPPGHRETYSYYLSQGQAAYDRKDLDKALEYSRRAFKMNPRSEEASLLYGYVRLSLAKADPFTLAQSLRKRQKKLEKKGRSGGNTANTLDDLKAVYQLSDGEIESMATIDRKVPDLPVMIPDCAEEARGHVERLGHLSAGIRAVCPFVDPPVRTGTEARHVCETFSWREASAKAHLLWAFLHLAEALSFHAVLTYTEENDGASNLERRAKRLKAMPLKTAGDITAFLDRLEGFEQTLSKVLPSGSGCSGEYPTTQFRATLNDLLATDAALRRIASVPEHLVAAIDAALKDIRALDGRSDTEKKASQAEALKSEFTKSISKNISKKIEEAGKDGVDEEERQRMCEAYTGIAPGGTAPEVCR